MNNEQVLILTHTRAKCVTITRIFTVKQLHVSLISLSILMIILLKFLMLLENWKKTNLSSGSVLRVNGD